MIPRSARSDVSLPRPEVTGGAPAATPSYGQIFRSTAFTGGASVINILVGIVRTKVVAVLLGPAGIGLIGIYMGITGLASAVAGMGIGSSGVRQVAESASRGDRARLSRTVTTLQRTSFLLGIIGTALLAISSQSVSRLTFGDDSHSRAIDILGFAVFFGCISAGQSAVIQGLRRISDLARVNVFGTVIGTTVGLLLIYTLRERGIVPLLVVLPAIVAICNLWALRRTSIEHVRVTWREIGSEARSLLVLGSAFMASGLMLAVVAYVTRLLIVQRLGLDAAGHYAAAYTLAAIYAGFILQAMGADFFPRLTAAAEDNALVNRLVNEQSEIALLMAIPGILATLCLAPWVIPVFYTGSFGPAIMVLQWQVLGMLGRVISWPMGFILLAKNHRGTFLWAEVSANGIHVALVAVGLHYCGVAGAGMAMAGMYLCYTALISMLSRRATGFAWSATNLRLLGWTLPVVACAFLAATSLPPFAGLVIGITFTLAASVVCLRSLLGRVPEQRRANFGYLNRWLPRN